MAEYVLHGEPAAGCAKEHPEQRNISWICYPWQLEGVPHRDQFEAFLSHAVEKGTDMKTAQSNADDREQNTRRCRIICSGKPDFALHLGKLGEKRLSDLQRLELYPMGARIDSHSGPGTAAWFSRNDECTE